MFLRRAIKKIFGLLDVGSEDYTDGNVLRADGDSFESTPLSHDDITSVTSGQHHVKYSDSDAQDAINNDTDHGETAHHDFGTF